MRSMDANDFPGVLRLCGGVRNVAVIWSLLSTSNVLRAITHMRTTSQPVPYGRLAMHALGETLYWTVITLLVLQLLDRWPVRNRIASALLAAAVLVSGSVLLVWIASALFNWTGFSSRGIGRLFLLMLPRDFHNSMFLLLFVLMVGISVRDRHAAETRRMRASKLETQLLEAQLHNVSTQFQPHFLFNMLNGIAATLRKDTNAAERMIIGLGDLLRFSLTRAREEGATLDDELYFVERYLYLQYTRIGDRLSVRIEATPEARHSLFPRFVLQPLVENAIKHGMDAITGRGEIRIDAFVEGERMEVRVRNTAPEPHEWRPDGVGLTTVRKRLELLYGGTHTLRFGVASGSVTATITLPHIRAA
jgi:two-component system, LytTR family, sensor kinase